MCVDESTGVLLRFTAEAADGTRSSMEATDIGDPEPSWFELPDGLDSDGSGAGP